MTTTAKLVAAWQEVKDLKAKIAELESELTVAKKDRDLYRMCAMDVAAGVVDLATKMAAVLDIREALGPKMFDDLAGDIVSEAAQELK